MSATGAQLDLRPALWRRLNWMWIVYFTILGAANLLVFHYFDEATWVDFKFYGVLGFTLLFVVAQGLWIAAKVRHNGTPQR
jgi:intracellular septation protein